MISANAPSATNKLTILLGRAALAARTKDRPRPRALLPSYSLQTTSTAAAAAMQAARASSNARAVPYLGLFCVENAPSGTVYLVSS